MAPLLKNLKEIIRQEIDVIEYTLRDVMNDCGNKRFILSNIVESALLNLWRRYKMKYFKWQVLLTYAFQMWFLWIEDKIKNNIKSGYRLDETTKQWNLFQLCQTKTFVIVEKC